VQAVTLLLTSITVKYTASFIPLEDIGVTAVALPTGFIANGCHNSPT